MPTSVKLRNMLDYSTAPIVIVGALLLLITLEMNLNHFRDNLRGIPIIGKPIIL